MKTFLHFVLLCLLLSIFTPPLLAQKNDGGLQKIVIIRHGEKPGKGDNLSCQGLNRALKLINVLHQKIGIPDHIYVPSINTGKATSTARMYQTIVPFAVKYNLDINSKYDVDDAESLVRSVEKKSGTVLIVWEHKEVKNILKNLGIANPPKWDDSDFDSMYIITFSNKRAILNRDKENIIPGANCN